MTWTTCDSCGRVINWFYPIPALDIVRQRAGLICLDCLEKKKKAKTMDLDELIIEADASED